ncbi:MAG: GAF domain-containing protein [Chlorobiaceae bacterium]
MNTTHPPFPQDPVGPPIDSTAFSLLASFPECALTIDLAGNILNANEALAASFSKRLEECLGANVYDLIANVLHKPAAAELHREKAKQVLQNGNKLVVEEEHNGQTCRSTIYPIRSSEGEITQLFIMAEDITERKNHEKITSFRTQMLNLVATESVENLLIKMLDEAERLTRSRIGIFHIIEGELASSSVQVLSTNLLKNMGAHAVHGSHPPMTMGSFWADVIREKKPLINNNSNTEAERTPRPHNHPGVMRKLVVPLLRDNKVIAVVGVGNKLEDYDENDRRMVSLLADLAWDIVAKKHAENEQKKIEEQFLHSQKMELVGQLAGGIAHDYNNMLAVILGHAEIGLQKADAAYSDLDIIMKAATRSAEITRQLLTFARKQPVSPKVVNLNTIVGRIIPMLRRLLGERISIAWNPDPLNLCAKIDPTQVDQILVNLCVNARDAINDDGLIAIETSLHTVDHSTGAAPQPCTTPGEYIMLAVTDNGCGISQDTLPHIFEPFFTTKDVGKGTGLGLSTVYGIAKQNHGFVDCQSKPGANTTVRLFFPVFEENAGKTQKEQLSLPLHNCKETILIVDDEPSILSLCRAILENVGFLVITASSPDEAIRLTEEHKGSIELLLTDVVMPEANGVELSRKLQSIMPELKTLFMSGYAPDYIFQFEGISDSISLIQKPFTPKMLVDSILPLLTTTRGK